MGKLQNLIVLFGIILLTIGALATTIDVAKLRFPVQKTVLPNGLTVLLHEDHSVPTVSYQTWFRVGSKNEEPGFTGIAHLFEHMMFKGAKRYSGKEFDRVLQANGVTNNAFTTYDYTGYFEDLSSSKLELIIDVESDRIENLALTPENLKSEREVVKEERRFRVDNNVAGALQELLWTTAFHTHPYKWPVIGWMPDIDSITLEKCKDFFHTNYSVSNAVVVVAGDIEPDQTLKLIIKYYGKLPKVDVPRPPLPSEPRQAKELIASAQKIVQSDNLAVAYHITKAGDDESYVMDLISNILAEGESSRLHKKFVYDTPWAVDVGGNSSTPQDPGLFEVVAQLKPGVSSKKLAGPLFLEIENLSREMVRPKELEKAKNQIMKHWVDSMKTIHGKAYSLVLNEVVTGNYENLFEDLIRYEKVTKEDILRVAKKYLVKSNRTVVTITPQKGAKNETL